MVCAKFRSPLLFWPDRSTSFVALIGALALALPLAACGRKGPLDPPPGGYVLERQQGRTAVSTSGAARTTAQPEQPPEYDEDGRPITPAGQMKKLPADWLID